MPRLALEGAFLLLVALLAGIADLTAELDRARDGVAWGLVALAEWAAAAKRSRWRLDEVAPPVAVPGPDAADSTGPWDMPVVESTAVASETRLGVEDDRDEAARRAGRERGRSRAGAQEGNAGAAARRKAAEEAAADP